MYFKDRVEAGRKLASELGAYKTKNTAVIALSESSIVVAAQIAQELHASLLLYMVRNITLPGEIVASAAISSTGAFRYNDSLSSAEVTEISQEFRNFIDQEKFTKTHDMHVLLGSGGEINKNMLRHHNIILVADALPDGFSLTMVYEYLKTVATKRIVVAVPVAGVSAIDRMHVVADELHVGGVTDNFLSIDHYYDENDKPSMEQVLQVISGISMTWMGKAEAEHARTHHMSRSKRSQVLSRQVHRQMVGSS